MYKDFYGLKENPFNLTPDPQFLYLSKKHADAFKNLIYGIKARKGFILITGEVGSGKTTICRALLNKLGKEVESALILNPHLPEKDLLGGIIEDLGMKREGESENELLEQLRNFLLKKLDEGDNVVIIIDEAQNLSIPVMEKIRLLSNLETEKEKLLQIILVGQSELEEKLKKTELRQVNQRIAVRYRLGPLKRGEIREYIQHRMRIAGSPGDLSFTGGAVGRVFKYSQGIPRVINLVWDRVLLAGYYGSTKRITARLVKTAIDDLRGDYFARFPGRGLIWLFFSLAVIIFGGSFLWSHGKIPGYSKKFSLFPATELTEKEFSSEEMKPLKEALIEDELIDKKEILKEVGGIAKNENRIAEDSNYRLLSINVLLGLWGINDNFLTEEEVSLNRGWNIAWFREIGERYGLSASYFRTDLAKLMTWNIPCILLGVKDEESNQYIWVVLLSISGKEANIFHPKKGNMKISRKKLSEKWENQAIIFWKDLDRIDFNLRSGMRGIEVKKFEKRLKDFGYFKGIPVRGIYGWMMKKAVIHFQDQYGLKNDGVVGPQTRMVLYHLNGMPSVPTLSLKQTY